MSPLSLTACGLRVGLGGLSGVGEVWGGRSVGRPSRFGSLAARSRAEIRIAGVKISSGWSSVRNSSISGVVRMASSRSRRYVIPVWFGWAAAGALARSRRCWFRRAHEKERRWLTEEKLQGFYLSTYFTEEKLSSVNITAPRLEKLTWVGRFEPRFLQRAHLQELGTSIIVYGPSLVPHHLRLFRHFEFVSLCLLLIYPPNSVNSYEYSMNGITFLPDMKNLVLSFISGAHTFGACVFHLLRLCAGIRRLKLMLLPREEPPECPLGCTCDQQNGWKSENILLNLLGEAEISGIKGVEHEVVFLRQLFRWATALEKMTITFDPLVAVSDNLCEEIVSFARSETCVEIYLYRNGRMMLFAPVV